MIISWLLLFLTLPEISTTPVKVVTTTSIFKDMIENIGGEQVAVHSIVPLGSDPHLYEAKPSDVTLCQEADIIMINGLHLEVWIEKLIRNSKTKAKIVIITQGIDSIKGKKYTDPHAWMDARNGKIYAENIGNALIEHKPELNNQITKRKNKYIADLEQIHLKIQNQIEKIPKEQRILVTNHDAFQYYGRRYGLKLVPLMGVSTEAEPKTSDIVKIIREIKKTGVKAIFVESSINPQLMAQIAQDMGINIGGRLFADSLGKRNSKASTYVDMLSANTDMIVLALAGQTLNDPTTANHTPDLMTYGLILFFLLVATILYSKKILKHGTTTH